MRIGDKCRLELAWAKVASGVQHIVEIFFKLLSVRFLGTGIIGHRFRRKVQAGQRTDAVDGARRMIPANNLLQTAAQTVGQEADLPVHLWMRFQIAKLRQTGAHCHGIAAERPRLIDRTEGRNQLHDLLSSAVCANRHTAADDLAISHQIRRDAKVSDCAVNLQTESGNDLIENQQCAVLVTELAQSRKERLFRHDYAHISCHRFDDDTGDLRRVLLEQPFHAVQIVINRREGISSASPRDSAGIRNAGGHDTGSGFDQHSISVAVVAALKLHDLISAGKASGSTHGTHNSLCAGVHHTHHLHARHDLMNQLRHLHFQCSGCTVAQTVFQLFPDGIQHEIRIVSQNHRPPRANVIDIGVAVLIIEVLLLGTPDKPRRSAHRQKRTHRRIDTAPHQFLGTGIEFL